MLDLCIFDRVIARTCRRLGVNVEVQDHAERTNLWDWLRWSGASALREFHPEKVLRRDDAPVDRWLAIDDREGFEAYRARLVEDPAGAVDWGMYRFSEPVAWLGVPDVVIGQAVRAGLAPIISMGYQPKLFPRPLAEPGVVDRLPEAEAWDWGAVASAYDYYFAMVHHFASRHGARHFLLHNEPEFYWERFFLPEELAGRLGGIGDVFDVMLQRAAGGEALAGALTNQMAILTWAARQAIDDAERAIGGAEGRPFRLLGPAWAEYWELYWQKAGQWADACDFHHYNRDPGTFGRRYQRVAARARGKAVALTEFGRRGGPLHVGEMLFDIRTALEAAGGVMAALEMADDEDAPLDIATFYHFRFPATHRNYKALAYGATDLVDWTGRDQPLHGRGEPCYPTFEELQVRHPTVALAAFRALARCAPAPGFASSSSSGEAEGIGNPVLRLGWGSFFGPEYEGVRAQAIRAGEQLMVNLLNPADRPIVNLNINLDPLGSSWRFCVVRRTARGLFDEPIDQFPLAGARLKLELPPMSLTQLILTPLALDAIDQLRLVEDSTTPGTIASGLALYETTRLRAIGRIGDVEVDLSDLNATWASSDPHCLRVFQGGLVLRSRAPERAAEVSAAVPAGPRVTMRCPGLPVEPAP